MEIITNYKILLVDDEPQNIKDLFEALNPDIYRMLVATNGKYAVEQAIKHTPDAIIMDWDMPEMNGMEAIKIIRHHDEIKDIPIIVATGKMTTVENLRTALENGANDYIRKPFDPIEIEARVNSMIKLNMEQKKSLELERELMQQKLDRIKQEMEINQQALIASKIRLISNSMYNESLIKNLQNISLTKNNVEKMIAQIISDVSTNDKSFNWKEFENHFEKVHPAFFSNLRKRFPDITTNETELCVFIKLNMTTKEITAITYKTEEALKKARQRLKKKFGLNIDDSLTNFIREVE
jgi:DNA-binding response OmpR family regulator